MQRIIVWILATIAIVNSIALLGAFQMHRTLEAQLKFCTSTHERVGR